MTVAEKIVQHKIVAIIRGIPPAAVMPVVHALYEGGIRAVEITLNSANALALIEEVAAGVKDAMLVGAGTVLNVKEAEAAINAGAQFIISPCLDLATIQFTKAKNKVSIPGAYTATEIIQAYNVGADIIKVFPAQSPQYIQDIRGPLGHIPLMPTGGVTIDNIRAFRKAGAAAFGVGSALVNNRLPFTDANLQTLTTTARAFVAAVFME